MKDIHYSLDEILKLEKFYRRNLINSLSGFKSANLIGTKSKEGHTNLAIFSSAVHIGADPPLLGLIFRPDSVERHTLNNIRETGFFTLNQVHTGITDKAHQTSARYANGVSEFEACSLSEEYHNDFFAPFVKESKIKMGLELVEELPIKLNGTYLIIGKILHFIAISQAIEDDGMIDMRFAQTASIGGLDTYYRSEKIARYAYAKPDQSTTQL